MVIVAGCASLFIACCACEVFASVVPAPPTRTARQAVTATATMPLPTFTPTPTFTPLPNPQVVLNVSGSVQQERTQAFYVQGSSQLVQWWCNPSTGLGGSYDVIIDFYTADGTDMRSGIVDTCEPGNTSGQRTFALPPGSYKLDLIITGWWHIKVTDEFD